MNGWESGFKDCLQQSKTYEFDLCLKSRLLYAQFSDTKVSEI